jgi:hypothetical protein
VAFEYVPALSALAGSAIGAMASVATTWLTQHSQDRARRSAESMTRRERLYGGFIDAASALLADALTHEKVDPSKFVGIYATIGKLRLFAPADVVLKADKAMRDLSEIYYLPNTDFARRDALQDDRLDILRAFAKACRNELRD